MATINYPNTTIFTKPQAFEFGLRFNTMIHTSPLTGYVQTVGLTGARWTAQITFAGQSPENAATIEAFIVSLKGQQNRLALYNLARPSVNGTGNGTPLVAGGSQTGTSINTDGWANSETVLKAGDMIGIGGELKMVTADVTSNGSGEATISFEPAIRTSPSDNSAVDITAPTALFILTENEIRSRRTQALYEPLTIDLVEVFA